MKQHGGQGLGPCGLPRRLCFRTIPFSVALNRCSDRSDRCGHIDPITSLKFHTGIIYKAGGKFHGRNLSGAVRRVTISDALLHSRWQSSPFAEPLPSCVRKAYGWDQGRRPGPPRAASSSKTPPVCSGRYRFPPGALLSLGAPRKEDPMNQRVSMVFDGAVAGIIGAFVIALWYLIFDAARGQPLGSLGSLAATLFGGAQPGAALMLGRLVFHFCVFALIGVVAAVILETGEHDETLFPTMMVAGPRLRDLLHHDPDADRAVRPRVATVVEIPDRRPDGDVGDAGVFSRTPSHARASYGRPVDGRGPRGRAGGRNRRGQWSRSGSWPATSWRARSFARLRCLGAAIFQGIVEPSPGAGDAAPGAGLHGAAFLCLHDVRDCDRRAVARGRLRAGVRAGRDFPARDLRDLFRRSAGGLRPGGARPRLGFWKILAGNVLAMAAMLGYFETRHRGWWSRFRERWEVLQLRRN